VRARRHLHERPQQLLLARLRHCSRPSYALSWSRWVVFGLLVGGLDDSSNSRSSCAGVLPAYPQATATTTNTPAREDLQRQRPGRPYV
jgi:hypothetical protein